eukprot:8262164-Ditylum_brightwellii.AAC.1
MYFVNEEMNTWYQHHRIANDWGGDLASVHSEEENNFISQISGYGYGPLHLGGRRGINFDEKHNNEWSWSDGSNWDYIQWD